MNLIIPISFFVMCVYILLVPFVISPSELIAAVAIIATGIPVYFIFVYYERKPGLILSLWSKFSRFP